MKKRWISVIIGCVVVALIAIIGNVCRVRTVIVKFDNQPVNVTADEVFRASGIETRRSILGINEITVKECVNGAFGDNSVYVRNIERVFPNKVIVYVEERMPLCAVKLRDPEKFGYEEGDGYGITDMDFQMNAVANNAEVAGRDLIYIDGVTVSDTYNTSAFAYIHAIFTAFEDVGLNASAQKKFIESINMTSAGAEIKLRDGNAITVSGTKDGLKEEIRERYADYLKTIELAD